MHLVLTIIAEENGIGVLSTNSELGCLRRVNNLGKGMNPSVLPIL